MDLESVVEPVVETAGMELVELTFRREGGGKILRVTIDKDGGLDLDSISEMSKRISRRLDTEGFDPGPYSLEVSSPGLERPLRKHEDFAKHVGEKVKVKTTEAIDGQHVHVGSLLEAGDSAITVATEAGERRIDLDGISAARIVFEWGPKGSKK
ncbi:MAG: ribosome maturation factor RimP [Actinomycetota bacterium]